VFKPGEVAMGASRLTTVPIDHSHSQQPVPRGFPLFKRCKWLVVNRDVAKQTSRKQALCAVGFTLT